MNLSFLGSASLGWWLGLALAIGVGWWSYHRLLAPLSGRLAWLLRIVRFAAMLLILLALLEPALTVERERAGEARLAVLIDRSSSMRLPGRIDSTRAAESARALADLRAAVGERFSLDVMGFADQLAPELSDARLSDGPHGATALGDALEETIERQPHTPAGAVVLLSDGVSTSGRDPAAVARSLPLPIHTVLLGDTVAPADLLVREVKSNPVAHAGEKAALRVIVSANGMSPAGATLSVREIRRQSQADVRGAILARHELTRGEPDEEVEIVLEFTPRAVGLTLYEVELTSLPGEKVTLNNRRWVALDVRAKKTRVLYLEGEPDWDFAFLKRIFAADTILAYDILVRQKDGAFAACGGSSLKTPPVNAHEFDRYAGVMIGRLSPAQLDARTVVALREFVLAGGGVFFLDAPVASEGIDAWRAAGWSDVLPIRVESDPRRGFARSPVRPTYAGLAHAITALSDAPDRTQDLWEELPPVWVREGRYQTQGDATVLLSGRTSQPQSDVPVLVLSNASAGRIGLLLARGFYRWDFALRSKSESAEPAHEFWMRLARWIAEPSQRERFRLEPVRRVFQDGEPIVLNANLSDNAFQPIDGARIAARVSRVELAASAGAERAAGIDVSLMPGDGPGRYVCTLSPLLPGMYRYEAQARSARGEQRVWNGEGVFWVEPMGPEYFRLGSSQRMLALLARVSGGSALRPEDIAGLVDRVPRTFRRARLVNHVEMWNHWLLFATLSALLSIEWFVRRRKGLA